MQHAENAELFYSIATSQVSEEDEEIVCNLLRQKLDL